MLLLHHSVFICVSYFFSSSRLCGTIQPVIKFHSTFNNKSLIVGSFINCKTIIIYSCSIVELLGKILRTLSIFHANAIWIVFTTWTMNHMFCYQSISYGISRWIWYFSIYKRVNKFWSRL
jgi:hypothetical protein